MRTLLSIGLVASMFLGASGRALAHHSHAMFDHDIEMTITGTVTDFAFNNPHVFLYLDVAQDNGEVVKYWIEMSSITMHGYERALEQGLSR